MNDNPTGLEANSGEIFSGFNDSDTSVFVAFFSIIAE